MNRWIGNPGVWNTTGRWMALVSLMIGICLIGEGCGLVKINRQAADIQPPEDYSPTDMDSDLGGALEPIPPADAPAEGPRPGQLLPFPEMQTIYFEFDRADIRPDQLDNIDHNLRYLLEHPRDKVYIIGHCDERGTVEYNFNLGERRAIEVKDYFIRNGVDAGRIGVLSRGEEEPVALGHNEDAWIKNRRAEFRRVY